MKKKNTKVKILSLVLLLFLCLGIVYIKNYKNDYSDISLEDYKAKTYTQVKDGDESIDGTRYVTFDAYYLRDINRDGYAEKLRGTCKEIGDKDTLYIDLNVITNGYLKDARIEINGKNFNLSTALVEDDVIAQDYISEDTNSINLKQINNGTQKLIMGIVKSGDYSGIGCKYSALNRDLNNYSVSDNTVTLTGTHVSDDGKETKISKTVLLTNDWYGTTSAEIASKKVQNYDISNALDETNGKLKITFDLELKEKNKQLILSKGLIEGEAPLINGYEPTNVIVNSDYVNFNYDKNTRKFTLERSATVEGTEVKNSVADTLIYRVTIEYPIEAYKTLGADAIAVNVPIKGYYEGYNNTSKEFTNPYKSNIESTIVSVVYDNPKGDVAIIDTRVGTYVRFENENIGKWIVSKELPVNIYNNSTASQSDRYFVAWGINTGAAFSLGTDDSKINATVTVKSTPEKRDDEFLDNSENYISMEKYVSNIGICFQNPEILLGAEGYIKVYDDDTNELLHTFTKEDWSIYTKSDPYLYGKKVKHIRVETSTLYKNGFLNVYNVKEIDDLLLTSDYSQEDFNNLSKIYSYATGYITINNQTQVLNNDIGYADYEMPYSHAEIKIEPEAIFNQETKEDVSIKINTVSDLYNTSKWKDGEFLIKYPEEIIDINIKDFTSNDGVEITGIETYREGNNLYTKIYTSCDELSDIELYLLADITADPRKASIVRNVELYAYNKECTNYDNNSKTKDVYDVNNNNNTEEYVGYTTFSLNIMAPSSLLTSQIATDYDSKGSVTIAPQVAVIEKKDSVQSATVNINLTNNYSGTISEIKVVGKIPFKGNKYQLNGEDLGSEYDTKLLESINLPDDLRKYAKVYYSYKEEVTEDINATKNGWTQSPDDISKVKSYLIDFQNYVMPIGEEKQFTYKIEVPAGVDYNKISYSDHAVYFCLDTDQGKLKTQTEPNKLGFKVTNNYDIELHKVKVNTNEDIAGVTFRVECEETGESKVATTFESGIAIINDLAVEQEYKIKEIKADDKYVINGGEITIIGHIVNGNLEIETLEGNFKENPVIDNNTDGNPKVSVTIENEIRYNLELLKTIKGTDTPIQDVRFELVDYNGKTKNYITNSTGIVSINHLEPNVQYTLKEVEADGYYLKDDVSFIMTRSSNGELQFNVISGEFSYSPQIDVSGEIPVVKAEYENEAIPQYSLKVIKTEKGKTTKLAGCQFRVTGLGIDEVITTNENGEADLFGLYQYVSGKNITGEYTLQEIYPSEGYILNEEPVVFKLTRATNGTSSATIVSGTTKNYNVSNSSSNNPTLNLYIENSPIFNLVKLDSLTDLPLPGVDFTITTSSGNEVTDANGNPIGQYYDIEELDVKSEGEYPWTQNTDGVWQSGNYNLDSTESVLETDEFLIDSTKYLSFDWSVSSESKNYDYVYYKVINTTTGSTVSGGDSSSYRIGGTSYGSTYDTLKYSEKSIKLSPGTYKLVLTYKKDSSSYNGLDRAFVKNIKLSSGRVIRTDENGEIHLSLPSGFYTIKEVNAPYGYNSPSYSKTFGVGKSQSAQYGYREKWSIEFTGIGSGEDTVTNFEDFGACRINDMYKVSDGIIVLGEFGQVAKIDYNGNLVWGTCARKVTFFIGSMSSDGYLYMFEMTSNCYKIDLSTGKIVWQKKVDNGNAFGDFSIATVNDGVVLLQYESYSNGRKRIIKLNSNGTEVWRKDIEENGVLAGLDDGSFLLIYNSGKVVKYNSSGNIVSTNTSNLQRTVSDFTRVKPYRDGVLVCYSADDVVYYDSNGNVINTFSKLPEGYWLHGTYVDSNEEDYIYANDYSKKITYMEKYQTAAAIPKLDTITVSNSRIRHKITTEVDGSGGTISGKGQSTYEYVYHGEDSIKDIIATPNSGYKVVKITVNGEEIQFTPDSNGKVTLDKFINMTEDKHIVVKFSNTASSVIEHHYIKDTTIKVADDKTQYGDIGTSYSTTPKMDLERYKLVKNTDGSYQIPSNASGLYTTQVQEITYYYEENPLQLVVHHYIDGTQDSVAPDEFYEGQKGVEYTTNPVTYPTLDEKYELVTEKIPSNANGTYTEDITVVTYYYKLKSYKITTEVEGTGGTITGENENPYETVMYKENSIKDIIIKPNEGFEISKITINGVEQNLPQDKKSEYTLDKFIQMIEDKHIIVKFEPLKDNITVYKVWKDENNKANKRPESLNIELYRGNELIETKSISNPNVQTTVTIPSTGETVNDAWICQFENIPLYNENGNLIEYTVREKEINTNDLYLYEESKEKIDNKTFVEINTFVVPDERIDIKATKEWQDNNNEKQKRPKEIKVLLKNGNEEVNSQVITTQENSQEIRFTNLPKYDELGNEIKYILDEVEINEGDLKFYTKTVDNTNFKIVNTYSVPTEKITLNITKKWVDNNNENGKRPNSIKIVVNNGVENIDEKTLTVNDEETQVIEFTDLARYDAEGDEIKYTIDEVEVNVDELKFYEKNVDNENYIITNTFNVPDEKVQLEVIKNWADNDNKNNKRPDSINLIVKNKDEIVATETIDTSNGNTQNYVFNNLIKYDENGNEIVYTVDESEVESDDLKFYNKNINGNIITNTFEVPGEKTSIKIKKIWQDNNNENGIRPLIIRVQIKNGENIERTEELNVNDSIQEYTIENLQKYDENGNEILYTIDEVSVEGYEKAVENLQITNTIKKYKITTEVNGEGGDISGKNENPYEEVTHKGDSKKDIVITPDESHEISKITINGQEQPLPENTEESYTLPIFEDVIEDKHVVVEFKKRKTNVKILHVLEGTDVSDPENVVDVLYPTEEITGRIDDSYSTQNRLTEINASHKEQYDFIKSTSNTSGKMVKDTIYVIYEYNKVPATIKIEHKDIDTDEDLITVETKDGIVGENYSTANKLDEINKIYENKYELVTPEPNNKTGVYEREEQTVTYYYKKKIGEIEVNYLEVGTNKVLASQVVTQGQVDSKYTTINKLDDINTENENKYEFVETTGNATEGVYKVDRQVINYWYQKKQGEIEVNYLEVGTNKVLASQVVTQGQVDSKYTTINKLDDINTENENKYEFVETTGDAIEGIYKIDRQTINYWYQKKPTKVITKYVDINSKEEIYDENTQNGRIDDEYTTINEIDNINVKYDNIYEFVESTDNIEGKMTEQVIEVIYYYQKKTTNVKVLHVLEGTDVSDPENVIDVLYPTEEITGRIDDPYTTKNRLLEINNSHKEQYDLVTDEVNNKNGNMKLNTIYVVYEYKKAPATIKIEHKDVDTNEDLLAVVTEKGIVGEDYSTTNRLVEINELYENKYELVIPEPSNKEGVYKREEQTITYYYSKKATNVLVKYVDIDTDEELAGNDEIIGKIDDEYETLDKIEEINEINLPYKYILVKTTDNIKGNMTIETIEVIYYYKKVESQVIVLYKDKETGEEILSKDYLGGFVGEEYTTKPKDIDGYELIIEEIPTNQNGQYAEETIQIVYWYKKIPENTDTADINVGLYLFVFMLSIFVILKKSIYYKERIR